MRRFDSKKLAKILEERKIDNYTLAMMLNNYDLELRTREQTVAQWRKKARPSAKYLVPLIEVLGIELQDITSDHGQGHGPDDESKQPGEPRA